MTAKIMMITAPVWTTSRDPTRVICAHKRPRGLRLPLDAHQRPLSHRGRSLT